MKSALVVGILFFAGALYNLFGPDPDPTEAAGGLTIAAILIGVFRFSLSAQVKDEELMTWMLANREAITGHGAQLGSTLVTPSTVLVRYQAALSFLIVSFKLPSSLYVREDGVPVRVPVLLTLVTLLLGWWGIPWGPVYTVQVVFGNLRGGVKTTVGEVLTALDEAKATMGELPLSEAG